MNHCQPEERTLFVSVPFDILSYYLNKDIIVLLAESADDSILRWVTGEADQRLKIKTYYRLEESLWCNEMKFNEGNYEFCELI